MQEVETLYGIPVVAIATLDDLMRFIANRAELREHAADAVAAYRARYGASGERATAAGVQ